MQLQREDLPPKVIEVLEIVPVEKLAALLEVSEIQQHEDAFLKYYARPETERTYQGNSEESNSYKQVLNKLINSSS